ncbi:hypothetical protein D3C81_1835510 [compost metagenome]
MVDQVDDAVQEWNVMRDENEGILVFLQITLQPYDVLLVQIVRRLVKEQNVRFL